MDERYYVYGEDADFAARARAAGYRPIITPSSEIIHSVGASSTDSGAKVTLLLAGKVTYFTTHFSPGKARLAKLLLQFGVLWRAVGSRLTGHQTRWKAAWTARRDWRNGFPNR
jgi:GT2 family glycosyltransferase